MLAVSMYPVMSGFKSWLCLSSTTYSWLLVSRRMDSNQEHSVWPYWPSAWPDSYLLEEEALLSSLPFPSFCCQPLCSTGSTVTQNSVLPGELDTIVEDDVLRFWDDMEQSEDNGEESEKGLPLLCYSEEKGAASNTMGAYHFKSEKVLTFELVSQYFYTPITQAARELNVGLTVLKKCRELGIPRWPHRKMKSLQTLISNVEVLQEAGKTNGAEQLRAMVDMLEQERRLLEQKPYVELEEKTKRLRLSLFGLLLLGLLAPRSRSPNKHQILLAASISCFLLFTKSTPTKHQFSFYQLLLLFTSSSYNSRSRSPNKLSLSQVCFKATYRRRLLALEAGEASKYY